jgi:hypothetical protein
MISIEHTNLTADGAAECSYDVELASRLVRAQGRQVPTLRLRVLALDAGGEKPPVLHQVPTPATQLPTSFAARCALEVQRQTFQIVQQGDTCWVIGGGATGAQYGVGEVLRCLLGVIWAGMHEEADTLFAPLRALPTGPQAPKMPLRARDGAPPPGNEGAMPAFLRWMARNRFNLWRRNSGHFMKQSEQYRRDCIETCRARGILFTLGDHAIDYFLPEEDFKEHPDWFGLRDGERVTKGMVHMPDCPHLDAILPIQPCWSNESMCETLTDRIAAHAREFPDMAVYGLWPHDGVNNWCQCEKCLKRTPYEHMYHLAMRLANKLPRHIPIELIAYSNLLNPPRNELPRSDRTFTMLCTYLRHYRHPIWEKFDGVHETGRLYPKPDRINPRDEREYGPLFDEWREVCRKTGSVLAIFEYGGGFYDETRRIDRTRYVYTPTPEVIAREIDWYIERDVKVYYICSAYRAWPDTFHETALGEMLWQGSAALKPFERDYYAAVFGLMGETIRATMTQIADALYGATVPAALLDRFDQLLASVPASPSIRRYQLWSRYIRLAKVVRQHEVAGDRQAMIAAEEPVIQFLDDHQKELAGYVAVPTYRKYATINQQRARDAVAGRTGNNYVL